MAGEGKEATVRLDFSIRRLDTHFFYSCYSKTRNIERLNIANLPTWSRIMKLISIDDHIHNFKEKFRAKPKKFILAFFVGIIASSIDLR